MDESFLASREAGILVIEGGIISQESKNTTSTTRDQDSAALVTPDGRYFVVRGRLWRATNPSLSKEQRQSLVKILMDARRSKGAAMRANDTEGRERARLAVEDAKRRLGERGEVWWTDGSPDYNRHLVKNSPYSSWYENLSGSGSPVPEVTDPRLIGRAGDSIKPIENETLTPSATKKKFPQKADKN